MSLTGYHNHKICVNVGTPTFLALTLLLLGAAPLRAGDSSSLLPIDKAFVQAILHKDAPAADTLLSPDFTWIDSAGKRFTREQVLQTFPPIANSDVEAQVRVYGIAAVVWANRGKMNVLRVWVKRATAWRIMLYQELKQVEQSETPAAKTSVECINPCKTIPFEPQTANEKEAIASWQGVMRAMAESDAAAYSPLIADEFTATDTFHDRPFTKEDRLAQINKQKTTGRRAAPQELLSAEMFDFGETVMMIAHEQRPGAKFYFNTRMWIKRESRWQMLFSFNTQIE
ncbi:MAG TPA: nuclear transport factor 2 family protein [Candidatus Acidoferrum sp.]|nr:nuclear transport factor 2 family protein [Candidatus Acidoferrum sp.]